MNCNKCGTPILPGEHVCRFCGAIDDFSERKVVESAPEIIDFDFDTEVPESTLEVIDFMLGEDEVSIDSDSSKDDIVNFDFDLGGNDFEEPETVKIPVDEIKEASKEDLILEEIKEEVKEEIKEESKEEEKKENKQDNRKEKDDDSEEPSSKGSLVFTIILSILLVASIVLNVYLITTNKKNVEEPVKTSGTLRSVVYSDYKFVLPSNWNSDIEKNLVVYDDSNSWAASISVSDKIDYSLIKDNTKKIEEAYGKNKYLLSSEYTKTVDNTEFYIFKGRYVDKYITYLIFNETKNGVVVTDLKYVSEIEEDILDKLLESLSLTDKASIKLTQNENFEFNDTLGLIENIIPKKED